MKKIFLYLFAGFALFLFVGGWVLRTPGSDERYKAKEAIGLCWETQARKSLTPETARFVAGTCERMEDDFTQKRGFRP
jgi:hypothetical protein